MRYTNINNLNILLVLLSITLLLSCGTSLRQQLLEEHSEWPDKYVQMIKDGNIAKGMTKDMVRAAWGSPAQNSKITGPSYSNEWVYETGGQDSYSSTYVYFKNGKVVKIDSGN